LHLLAGVDVIAASYAVFLSVRDALICVLLALALDELHVGSDKKKIRASANAPNRICYVGPFTRTLHAQAQPTKPHIVFILAGVLTQHLEHGSGQ
jgi:hypothetical protein